MKWNLSVKFRSRKHHIHRTPASTLNPEQFSIYDWIFFQPVTEDPTYITSSLDMFLLVHIEIRSPVWLFKADVEQVIEEDDILLLCMEPLQWHHMVSLATCRLKFLATWMLFSQFVRPNITENIKARHFCPFVRRPLFTKSLPQLMLTFPEWGYVAMF